MKRKVIKNALSILAFTGALALASSTSYSQENQQYVSLLPKVKERMFQIDPSKGYLVKEIKRDVYVITDNGYQSLFVTTGQGVMPNEAAEGLRTSADPTPW